MLNLIKPSKVKLFEFRQILIAFCLFVFIVPVLFTTPADAQVKALENLRETGKAFAAVAKKVSPAVVFIKIEKTIDSQPAGQSFSPFGDDLFRHFFGLPFSQGQPRHFQQIPHRQEQMVGQGSGFIISSDGYIMTNNHVVGNTDKVVVSLKDGREFKAKTIGTDPHSDIAIIKIDAKDLPVLSLGNSDKIEVGQWVLAIGNPFGLSDTLTAGIVSAKGRSSVGITDYENFIQTDAAINPGNSGGPLVNLDGEAIGMNTAIFSKNGGSMGIGFAIPINMAKDIGNQLIKNGSVTRGFLGIIIQNITPGLAKTFGLKDHKGVLISQVTKDSPADKSGLKQGDVIIEFDGKPVDKVGPFRNRVSLKMPGTKGKIVVLRDGKPLTLFVTLGKLPANNEIAGISSHRLEKLGLSVQTLTQNIADQLGYQGETGVVVSQVDPGSIAALAGIKPGALIQEVNRKKINNVEDFNQAIEKAPKHKAILMLIRQGKYSRYLALETS